MWITSNSPHRGGGAGGGRGGGGANFIQDNNNYTFFRVVTVPELDHIRFDLIRSTQLLLWEV